MPTWKDAAVEGHTGAVLGAAVLLAFGFLTLQQVRLDLVGRTVPATLLEERPIGRGRGICVYAFAAEGTLRTLKGGCYSDPSPSVDYLPSDPGLARCHGQPSLRLDAAGAAGGLALLAVSLRHLRRRRDAGW